MKTLSKLIIHLPNQALHLDFFVNPIPAVAMLVMAANDHWAKGAYPGWLTGKISDFAGVFYFPLFVCAVICLVENYLFGRASRGSRHAILYIGPRLMLASCLFTALLMTLVKLSGTVNGFVEAEFSRRFFTIRLARDPSDLLSLVMLPLSYSYAKVFFGKGPSSDPLKANRS